MKNKQAFIEAFNYGFANKEITSEEYYNDILKPEIEDLDRKMCKVSRIKSIIESKKEGFKIGQESDDTCKDPIKHFECWENWKGYELPKEV